MSPKDMFRYIYETSIYKKHRADNKVLVLWADRPAKVSRPHAEHRTQRPPTKYRVQPPASSELAKISFSTDIIFVIIVA